MAISSPGGALVLALFGTGPLLSDGCGRFKVFGESIYCGGDDNDELSLLEFFGGIIAE